MAIDRRVVHFRSSQPDEVIDEVERIADRGDGREWITISPWVDPEDLPVVSLLRRWFSARGSKIPEVTWVPAQSGEPAQLGVLHATGPGAIERLEEHGVAVPDRWRMIGDHSKRGLLFAVHPDSSPGVVVEFAVDAARALAEVPTDERWLAEISSAR